MKNKRNRSLNKLILLVLLQLFNLNVFGQNDLLKVGDKIPDLVFRQLVNCKNPELSTKDLANKLIILDIGWVGCSDCMLGLRRLDSVQEQFKDKIQIMWLTISNTKELKDFLNDNFYYKGSMIHSIPMVPKDTTVTKYFMGQYIPAPYEVWIDGNGIIKGISNPEYVDSKNIENALGGRKIASDNFWMYDYNMDDTFFTLNQKNFPRIGLPLTQFHSALTGHIDNYFIDGTHNTVDSSTQTVTRRFYNNSILQMYYTLSARLGLPTLSSHNRCIIKVKDPSRIIYDRKLSGYKSDWDKKNTFCYEITYPLETSRGVLFKRIINDLNCSLGLNGRIIDTVVACWVIKKGLNYTSPPTINTDYEFKLSELEDGINYYGIPPVFVDEGLKTYPLTKKELYFATSPYFATGALAQSFPEKASPYLERNLLAFLASKHMILKTEKRKVRMLVLTDAN